MPSAREHIPKVPNEEGEVPGLGEARLNEEKLETLT